MDKKKLRYAILKEIDKGTQPLSEIDFGLDENTFDNTIRFLSREGYIIGVWYADDRPHIDAVEITEKGEEFLEENKTWAKAYKGLKEIKEWIPFIY